MDNAVKVRIAVAVDERGDWVAVGRSDQLADESREDAIYDAHGAVQVYWLTAELPLPVEPELAARVEDPAGG